MNKSIFILFISAVILFFVGYNFVFNTHKTIAAYKSIAKIEKGTFLYNALSSDSHLLWMKIIGLAVLFFSLITFLWSIILFFKK